jgi:hypothetical protein
MTRKLLQSQPRNLPVRPARTVPALRSTAGEYGVATTGGPMSDNEDISISLSITPAWSILKDVQDKTEACLRRSGASRDVSDATIMCASELLENAIKYGSSVSGKNNITFDLGIHEGTIRIRVANGITDEQNVRNVASHIGKIQDSTDPGVLYTERLRELMENQKPGVSQLGLYRIAYEGEFALDFTYNDGTLIIQAERPFST